MSERDADKSVSLASLPPRSTARAGALAPIALWLSAAALRLESSRQMVLLRTRAGGCVGRAPVWSWAVLECCVLALLVSGLHAAATRAAPQAEAAESEARASLTRWELRGLDAAVRRPGLLGVGPSIPRVVARRSLAETNSGTTPCKGKLQGSLEAELCCKGLGEDEAQCKKAVGVCQWYDVDTKNGAHQEGGCLKFDGEGGMSGGVLAFFCIMAVLAAIPIYKCCCTAKLAKESAVSLEPLEPHLSASSQMYWASQNE